MAHDDGDIKDFWNNTPDDFEEWRPAEQVEYWANWFDVYIPEGYLTSYDNYVLPQSDGGLGGSDENIRGLLFPSIIDAAEYLWGTGVYPWSYIIVDDDDYFHVGIEYPEET
ncbi:MAG: hypothetical protein WC734_06195 [Patescibacteria group bacterium]|jgi:hypothetical protein